MLQKDWASGGHLLTPALAAHEREHSLEKQPSSRNEELHRTKAAALVMPKLHPHLVTKLPTLVFFGHLTMQPYIDRRSGDPVVDH